MTKRDTQVEAYKGYFNELGIEFSEDIGDFDENSSEYIKVFVRHDAFLIKEVC
jgi:hypothetical protein